MQLLINNPFTDQFSKSVLITHILLIISFKITTSLSNIKENSASRQFYKQEILVTSGKPKGNICGRTHNINFHPDSVQQVNHYPASIKGNLW